MMKVKKASLLVALGLTTLLVACNDSEKVQEKEKKHSEHNIAVEIKSRVTVGGDDYTYPIGANGRLMIDDNLGLSMEQAIQTVYVNDIVSDEEKTYYSTNITDKSKHGRTEQTELSSFPLIYYKAEYLHSIDTEFFVLQVFDKSAEYQLTYNEERPKDTISVHNTIGRLALVDVPKINEQYGQEVYEYIQKELSKADEIEVVEEIIDIYYLNQNVPLIDDDTSNYYIYVDGELLNAKVVEKGLGIVSKYILDEEKDFYYIPETKDIRENIKKAEVVAKSERKGVWSVNGYVSEKGFPSSEIDSNVINRR